MLNAVVGKSTYKMRGRTGLEKQKRVSWQVTCPYEAWRTLEIVILMQRKSLNYSRTQSSWKILQTKDKPRRENKSVYDKSILLVRMWGILRMLFLPCGKKHEPKSKKRCHTAENDQRAPRIMVKRISAYGLCYSPDSKATEDPANEDFWSWRIGTRDFSGIGTIRRGVSHYLKKLSS